MSTTPAIILAPAPASPKLFRVTSVDRKGAKPHISRVFAHDAKAAAAKAIATHRGEILKAEKAKTYPNPNVLANPQAICITTLSVTEAPITTLPKPKLKF